jgi:hypothetical protein
MNYEFQVFIFAIIVEGLAVVREESTREKNFSFRPQMLVKLLNFYSLSDEFKRIRKKLARRFKWEQIYITLSIILRHKSSTFSRCLAVEAFRANLMLMHQELHDKHFNFSPLALFMITGNPLRVRQGDARPFSIIPQRPPTPVSLRLEQQNLTR